MKASAKVLSPFLFLSFLVLYGATLCRGIFLGDSGELTATAALLDIAHPPGYPLYTLAGRLFALARPDHPALALNAFSALAAAVSVGLFFLLARRFAGTIAALAAALLLGLSPLVWSHAVVAEVYALHLALFLVTLLLVSSRNPRRRLLAGFCSGLAVAAHPLGIGLVPLLVVARDPSSKDRRVATWVEWVATAVLFALGITLYLYLPVRSALDPPTDWGNPDSAARLAAHVLRSQYDVLLRPERSAGLFLRQAGDLFRMLAGANLPVAFLPLLPLGLVGLLRHRGRGSLLAAAGLAVYGPLLVAYLDYPIAPARVEENLVFFLPLLTILLLLLAVGAEEILRLLAGTPALRAAFGAVLLLVVAAWAPGAAGGGRRDRVVLPERYAREILASLPERAILIARGDDIVFPLLYLQEVERVRPDVSIRNPAGTVLAGPADPIPGDEGRPRYRTDPAPGLGATGLVFREEDAPPLGDPPPLPRDGPAEALLRSSTPLRSLWTNYVETRARASSDVSEAARFRLAALTLTGARLPEGEGALSYAEALVLAERGASDKAERILARLVAKRPGELLPRFLLAELLVRANRNAEAAALVVTGAAERADEMVLAARLLIACGREKEAVAELERAAKKAPREDEARALLQEIAFRAGEWDRAARLGQEALEIEPALADVRLRRARALRALGREREAAREYGLFLRVVPGHPAAGEAEAFLHR